MRQGNAALLESLIREKAAEAVLTQEAKNNSRLFFGVVLADTPVERVDVLNDLEDAGIETRDLFPLINQEIYAKFFGADAEGRFPVADRLRRRGFIVGCHQHMDHDDIRYLAERILKSVAGV